MDLKKKTGKCGGPDVIGIIFEFLFANETIKNPRRFYWKSLISVVYLF